MAPSSGQEWEPAKLYIDHRFQVERERQKERRLKAEKQREASAAIAEFLGEWIKPHYFDNVDKNQQLWVIQTTYWKTILMLDKELLDDLLPLLAHKQDLNRNDIIVKARQILLGLEEPDISPSQLNNWFAKPQKNTTRDAR